jgi:hypothetical protein
MCSVRICEFACLSVRADYYYLKDASDLYRAGSSRADALWEEDGESPELPRLCRVCQVMSPPEEFLMCDECDMKYGQRCVPRAAHLASAVVRW